MTARELAEIAEQRMEDPKVVGRLVCNLRSSTGVEQRSHDGRELRVEWQDVGDFWRCVISSRENAAECVAQADVHENGTLRVDSYEPCRLTISPEEGILCLTRYKVD